MKIDVSNLLTDNKLSVDYVEKLTMPSSYNIINNLIEVNVKGEITKIKSDFVFDANIKSTLRFYCNLCLEPVDIKLDFCINELFSDDEVKNEDIEVWKFTDNILELDEIVLVNILLNIPMKIVCSEQCKGLCPVCGKNLNFDECECDKNVNDNRFAELFVLMKDKEV